MKGKITIKRFARGYIDDLIRIFELSIKKTCDKDYTEGQIAAWLSGADKDKWIPMFESHYSLVAFLGKKPVGFGDIGDDGYLNMLYVHPRYQRRGIAALICDRLEKHAQGDIIVDASCTAKDFFLKRGYKVMMKQTVYRKGVALDNFRMSKRYADSEIGKRYGYLTVLEDTGKKYHSTKIYKCRCDCGKEIEVNINKLHTGHVKSCGCKNDENRANLPILDRGLIDGTMKCGIKADM